MRTRVRLQITEMPFVIWFSYDSIAIWFEEESPCECELNKFTSSFRQKRSRNIMSMAIWFFFSFNLILTKRQFTFFLICFCCLLWQKKNVLVLLCWAFIVFVTENNSKFITWLTVCHTIIICFWINWVIRLIYLFIFVEELSLHCMLRWFWVQFFSAVLVRATEKKRQRDWERVRKCRILGTERKEKKKVLLLYSLMINCIKFNVKSTLLNHNCFTCEKNNRRIIQVFFIYFTPTDILSHRLFVLHCF